MATPTVPTPDPIPDDLTPEERRAVARQGSQIEWERSIGNGPRTGFDGAEWGDAEEWRG